MWASNPQPCCSEATPLTTEPLCRPRVCRLGRTFGCCASLGTCMQTRTHPSTHATYTFCPFFKRDKCIKLNPRGDVRQLLGTFQQIDSVSEFSSPPSPHQSLRPAAATANHLLDSCRHTLSLLAPSRPSSCFFSSLAASLK